MTAATQPAVLAETHGAVCTVTLNRPDKRNAIDLQMRVVLAEAIEAAAADDTIRVIVIIGAGPAFCSGGDISTMKRLLPGQALDRVPDGAEGDSGDLDRPQPVLAAVEGSAYGAGTALAAACDRVVAAQDATFATTFTNVGLAGDMGIFVSLPALGRYRAGAPDADATTPLSAAEATAVGLVDVVAEPGEALAHAYRDAQRLAAGPVQALAVIKRMLAVAPMTDRFDALDRGGGLSGRPF